jgi:hypothetical protein
MNNGVTGFTEGDADARRRHNLLASEYARSRQFPLDSFRHADGIAHVPDVVEQYRKLITTQTSNDIIAGRSRKGFIGDTGDHIRPAQGSRQAAGGFDNQLVSPPCVLDYHSRL